MFGFLSSHSKDADDPLVSPRATAVWLKQLPALDVIGRQQHVMRAFDAMRQSRRPLEPARLQAVEFLDSALGADRRQLIKQYVENHDTAPKLAERVELQPNSDIDTMTPMACATLVPHAAPFMPMPSSNMKTWFMMALVIVVVITMAIVRRTAEMPLKKPMPAQAMEPRNAPPMRGAQYSSASCSTFGARPNGWSSQGPAKAATMLSSTRA